ncbi:ribonuclease [Actinopolyspora mortivallis]|uniref:Ribonuclease n=2 Tax=Actinopolyspora mortivallis TaxID=33906 RepID=A0A2T0GSP8_ACTMO|nr:ribonuclease [Actinopolyspora mortivallis]
MVTEEPLSGVDRALGSIIFLRAARSVTRGAESIADAARLRGTLRAWEEAGDVIDSLRSTGRLPKHYVTKAEARAAGWEEGKALGNYLPDAQIGGDVFTNGKGVLPEAPGRVWREADIGLDNMRKRSKQPGTRLVYSDDGLLYVTATHYKTVEYVGRYK